MELGLQLGYWAPSPPTHDWVELAREAENCGYDSVWTSETWGSDAFSPLVWLAAHTSRIRLGTAVVQLAARTPTATAMHAMTLDHLSGGRFTLGLGVSGPQVVEGWYGVPYRRPLARTREYVATIRQVLARQIVRDEHAAFPHPYHGEDATGLGKPLRTNLRPLRRDLPIHLGAEGPRNVALAAEIADGWLPLYYPPGRPEVYADSLAAAPKGFEITALVPLALTSDDSADALADAYAPIRANLAFYIGGMGARSANFHADLVARLGFADAAELVQRLYLEGRREEAAQAVPIALADEISLVGSVGRIRERLALWRASPVTRLLLAARDPATLRTLADIAFA